MNDLNDILKEQIPMEQIPIEQIPMEQNSNNPKGLIPMEQIPMEQIPMEQNSNNPKGLIPKEQIPKEQIPIPNVQNSNNPTSLIPKEQNLIDPMEQEYTKLEQLVPMPVVFQQFEWFGKNRYSNVLPNRDTCVVLNNGTNDGTNDKNNYINANYIFANNRQECIMTQAPLNTTIDDFWNMVWQQNSRRIFMLCNCQELNSNGLLRTKCVEYWDLSNNQSNKFQSNKFQSNKFSIKIISSINIDNTNNTVVLRTLSLRKHNGNNSEKEERLISHYQYVGWPDFGIPSDTSSFMALIRIYLSRSNSNSNNNDIIHCSAGIGRSGCFVAVILGILHPHLSLFEIVQQIRKCRNGAVQGLEQYQFINRCFELVRSRE